VVVGIVAAGVALWPRDGGVDAPPAGPTPSPTAPASPTDPPTDGVAAAFGGPLVAPGDRLVAPVPAWDGEITAWVRGRELRMRGGGWGVRASGTQWLDAGGRAASLSPQVLLGEDGSVGVVVHLVGTAGYELVPYVTRIEGADGSGGAAHLTGAATVDRVGGSPPFRSGFARRDGARHRVISWVEGDGYGYTVVVPRNQTHRDPTELAGPVEAWRWTLAGERLRPERLGGMCVEAGSLTAC